MQSGIIEAFKYKKIKLTKYLKELLTYITFKTLNQSRLIQSDL